jgi:hypothetical protein
MAVSVERSLDFGGVRRIENLPPAAALNHPAVLAQLLSDRIRSNKLLFMGNVSLLGTLATTGGGTGATINSGVEDGSASKQITNLDRYRYATGTTETGSAGGYLSKQVFRGNGFYLHTVFGIETHQSAMQYFHGLANNAATLSGDPSSTLTNCIGLCKDAGDSNWHLLVNNGSNTTKTDTEVAATAGDVLKLDILASPDDSKVYVSLTNLTTGVTALSDSEITANLPSATQGMKFNHLCRSTSGTTAKVFCLALASLGESIW